MRLQSIKKGFTLIELLVVITIIGILATGGVSVFTTQLQGARDSTRISDMKLIETGIHQYFNDATEYPPETTLMGTGGIAQYLSKQLVDPKTGKSICWDNANSNNITCGWYYNKSNDAFGLTDSAFKLGITFEKKVNVEQKAQNDGGTGTINAFADYYFETFAGAGAKYIWVGTGAFAVIPDTYVGVNTDMLGSDSLSKVY